jgi:hypothetical protein
MIDRRRFLRLVVRDPRGIALTAFLTAGIVTRVLSPDGTPAPGAEVSLSGEASAQATHAAPAAAVHEDAIPPDTRSREVRARPHAPR